MSDLIVHALSILRTSVDRWAAISGVDPSLLARQPEPGQWSAIQALQHAVDTELEVYNARVLAIRAGESFPGFDPETRGHVHRFTHTAPQLVDQLRPMRAQSLASLEALVPADLDRTGTHSEFGRETMAELLNQWAAHDTMHIVQAERALMQAFIPASGPWRSYFADHDVERPVAS